MSEGFCKIAPCESFMLTVHDILLVCPCMAIATWGLVCFMYYVTWFEYLCCFQWCQDDETESSCVESWGICLRKQCTLVIISFCFVLHSHTELPSFPLQKPPKAAEGYPDNATVLFKSTSVADFVTGEDYLQLLASTNRLLFDRPSAVFSKHPHTTEEIKQYCEDIKVLGPR